MIKQFLLNSKTQYPWAHFNVSPDDYYRVTDGVTYFLGGLRKENQGDKAYETALEFLAIRCVTAYFFLEHQKADRQERGYMGRLIDAIMGRC